MRTFFPLQSMDVTASPPHPKGTAYRVGLGVEYFSKGPHNVMKIQVVQDGAVVGPKPATFPVHTDDLRRVLKAVELMEKLSLRAPMTVEQLQAFQPRSAEAKRLREVVTNESLDRVVKGFNAKREARSAAIAADVQKAKERMEAGARRANPKLSKLLDEKLGSKRAGK